MVKSPLSDVEIPEVAIHQLVFQMMDMFSDRVGVIDGVTGREYKYEEILTTIRNVASGLKKRGLQQREIVALFSPNCAEYIFIFFATLACGATVTTINPVYTAYEVSKHLEDSKPKFIFANPETAATAMKAQSGKGAKPTCIVSGSFSGAVSMKDLMEDDGSSFPENVDVNVKEDVVTIPYSSGTTGFPKGVMITHYNLLSNIVQLAHPEMVLPPSGSAEGDPGIRTTISFLPFFHAYGMVGVMIGTLLRGDRLIIMPRFEPERFLQLIQQYKVTHLPVVPPVIVFLTKSPLAKKYDLSSVQSVSSGAAPLSSDTEKDFVTMMKVPEIKQGYGMTETTVCCAYPPASQDIRAGSCGVPLPNSEMQVVDPNTKAILGPGERGEIWVRGPNVMKGYLNRPDATRETLDSEGWLHTGDIGYYDKDCYFYIVDRIKELIKFKGFQVAPAELESLLLNHPQIDDVAVIGIPDKEAGELPKAYVVRKPGTHMTEDDVKKYVADHMSSFKHLRGGVEFLAAVPKSQSGKILRRELRDRLKKSNI